MNCASPCLLGWRKASLCGAGKSYSAISLLYFSPQIQSKGNDVKLEKLIKHELSLKSAILASIVQSTSLLIKR